MRGPLAEFARGVGCFARGQLLILRRPSLAGWAVLPPLVISLVLFVAVLALATYAEALVTWATPFADGWHPIVSQGLRWVVAVALVIAAVYAAVQTFAVLTLSLGMPAYERIQRRVDRLCGGIPASRDERRETPFSFVGELGRGLRRSAVGGLLVFGVGLVPVVGSVAAPVVGAVVGSRNVVGELIEPAFAARGRGSDAERQATVARHPASSLGFGILAYLALLVPFVGVALFPGAVAGATLLTREWFDEPTSLR